MDNITLDKNQSYYGTQTFTLNNQEVEITLFLDEIKKSDLQQVLTTLESIELLYNNSRNLINTIHSNKQDEYYKMLQYFIDFHLDELKKLQSKTVEDEVQFLNTLELTTVSIHYNYDGYSYVLDFTYEELSDEILCFEYDDNLELISIAHES